MRIKKFAVIVLSAMCTAATALYGQMDRVKLYNISREEGLPSENVQQIFQDSYGFLWIASFDGLFRWDGSSYKRYFSGAYPNSLSNNVVYVVFEDYKKRLWIGTLSGLDYYRHETDDFVRCEFDTTHAKIAVNALAEDSHHQLWVGASSGLFHYDADRQKSTMYATGQNNGMSDHVVFGMDIDAYDNIWLGTFHGGVNKFSIAQKKFTPFMHRDGDPATVCSNMINEIRVDNQNHIWVGSYDNGISVLNQDGAVLKHYRVNPSNKIQNIVSSIYQDKQNRMWIGSIRERLQYLDEREDKLKPFENSPYKKTNIFCESVTCIQEDRFDNIWFGTQIEGMFYSNKNKNIFEYYSNDDNFSKGLNGKIITSFLETQNGMVWIGTNAGLSLFNPASKKFKSFTTRDGLTSNDIYDVKEDRSGNVWIAAWNGGVSKLDVRTNRVTSFLHETNNINSLNYNNVKTILPEDSIIWIGTHGEGLAAYKINEHKFVHAKNNSVFPFDMGKPAWINHLMRDSHRRLWISTYNGIFVYDQKILRHYSHALVS